MNTTSITNQNIRFIQLQDWAILPSKPEKEPVHLKKSQHLRYVHNQRIKGVCRPYVQAQQLGWIIRSPFDLDIEPVDQEYQIACEPHELEDIGTTLGIDYWIKRGDVYLGLKPDGWFRVHQAWINNMWQALFIPNGEKTFEWRLGWGVQCPDDHVLMILPLDSQPNIKIHPGILDNTSLQQFNDAGLGLSLAFEPTVKAKIKKNEPIARIITFHKSTLGIKDIQVVNTDE